MEGFRTLKQGSRVSYELVQGPKGDLAQNICPLQVDDPGTTAAATQDSAA
jgi:CspA family cold shock protein